MAYVSFVNWTETRADEMISTKELPPSHWPLVISMGIFLIAN